MIMYRRQWSRQSPIKRNAKRQKWLSEEAIQIAEKRREVKGKGVKERHTYLNAEFQRIVRRDKKAFLSDQCKEIEENNRMGKTRNPFKKARDTKGTLASSVQFSRSVMYNSLRPHESQHARPPCPSPTPRVHSNSCPLSLWCHPAISSSVRGDFKTLKE